MTAFISHAALVYGAVVAAGSFAAGVALGLWLNAPPACDCDPESTHPPQPRR